MRSGRRPTATLADYVAMARPDHWAKHIFIAPGVALAFILHPRDPAVLALPILVGFASACAVASANYVLNEWLDLRFDRHHPVKSLRPAVQKQISRPLVIGLYFALAAAGLGLAVLVSPLFAVTSVAFLLSGVAYNVPGIRTKDRPYLDVVSEA
ncbi:MAG: UbiA family prenyltransferase, partial [Acidobacteriota bacterium]